MRFGLVLEGGAMRGLYSAGVIDVLLDNDIKFDTVVGVSAGALFGINLKSKQRGRVLRYNKAYAKNKNYMGLYSLMTTGNVMNKKFCFDKLINELDIFDYDTYEKNPTNFYAVVTNVVTGEPEYININNIKDKLEYLRASGSMPYVSRKVLIDNSLYLDGGISDSIPVKWMLDNDYDKIVVVLTRPSSYYKKKNNPYIAKLFYRHYPNLVKTMNNRYLKYNETIAMIRELDNDGKIFVIRPKKVLDIKKIEKNINKINDTYDVGVNDMREKLSDLKKYLIK